MNRLNKIWQKLRRNRLVKNGLFSLSFAFSIVVFGLFVVSCFIFVPSEVFKLLGTLATTICGFTISIYINPRAKIPFEYNYHVENGNTVSFYDCQYYDDFPNVCMGEKVDRIDMICAKDPGQLKQPEIFH